MKLTLVVGARPNFMKISPIIKAIEEKNSFEKKIIFRLVHTGQHFDNSMSGNFFEQLKIPHPHVNLNCGNSNQTEQTACIMIQFEKELLENRPDIVLVVGDVNSTMACAIVAKKLKIKVAHVEAGLRSYDRDMPEEINRILTDSITDYFFTTSEYANNNLLKENISENKIYFVGNTMIDCLINNLNNLKKSQLIESKKVESKKYFILTLHRPSNVDDSEKLRNLLLALDEFTDNTPIIFPVHPRTKKNIEKINIKFKNLMLIEPQSYLEFIYLIQNSIGVITDSGGITEETTFLNIPCVTLRNSTERPETLYDGTNILVGDDMSLLKTSINKINNNSWNIGKKPMLWDGLASERIVTHLLEIYNDFKKN